MSCSVDNQNQNIESLQESGVSDTPKVENVSVTNSTLSERNASDNFTTQSDSSSNTHMNSQNITPKDESESSATAPHQSQCNNENMKHPPLSNEEDRQPEFADTESPEESVGATLSSDNLSSDISGQVKTGEDSTECSMPCSEENLHTTTSDDVVSADIPLTPSNLGTAQQPDVTCAEQTATLNFTEEQPGCSSGASKSVAQSIYHIKWIKFNNEMVPIITQNENGPCPLIAIMNVLLVQGKVKLPPMMEMVTSSQLMDYFGDCILEYAPKNINEDALLNYEQNMHDAMTVFHKLQTGLDVNVRFTGVSTFEYTSECIIFDLLEIPLYHGWLVDPADPNEQAAVGPCSYNQLVEKIIAQKNSPNPDEVTEALTAEEFLNRTSHQLTYHGLCELASTVKERELCVFFRNNHFSTLHKQKNELFLLVTDQGFLTESNVVWETLSNVEGDGHFVDASFQTFRKSEPSTHPIPPSSVPQGTDQQIDQDYLVALSLQEEQPPTPAATPQPEEWQPQPHLSDHELALKLQEEENRRAATAMQRQQQQPPAQQPGGQQSAPPRSQQPRAREAREAKDSTKKGDCQIL